jgi:hypothetical protein
VALQDYPLNRSIFLAARVPSDVLPTPDNNEIR